ncbi:Beta-monoglucosyldiacylglycerol synthase [Defluviimonas aquaemixtae]|uniref:Beta-monoglucosyldiacylglycerol synthase n=1 Tax=Albidovulum aquaemixtae TaxID=1542388 RepID=A0A2R8B7A9_9RHOB|nr:glycosyltransferase [Defluviimonas aquaemixtae]SPH18495.1 Beta-monoglucosyldiacylglycerol synthase [Defluviimonas aquaemixtae]
MPPAAPHLRLVAPSGAPKPADVPLFGPRATRQPARAKRRPLGQILIDMKAVEPGNMLKAIALRDREDARLGDILLTRGWVSDADLMAALSLQWGARPVDLVDRPPDARLLDSLGAEFCLSHGVLPWRRIGGAVVLATSRPEEFAATRAALPPGLGPVIMALAPERDIHEALIAARQTALVRKAETRVAEADSCRSQDGTRAAHRALILLTLCAAGLLAAPMAVFALAALWAVVTLTATTGLKLACFLATLRAPAPAPRVHAPLPRLPVVSMMVPLYHEDDIAPRLIRRLGRIDYPKELLDVLLVVEEDDLRTQAALAARLLPRWMRVVTVPTGPIRTKPRALNYALDFCRGSIIGIWDAEDAPDPGQIHVVVRRFSEAAPDVACLQGVLDFYNSRHNWLTRCFTIEYAAWFRAMLPGLARLGFVVPLGGTTLYFRRDLIEELGGWDAHNVTEDADLGLRLARRGYRTEIIDTVTEEEPNARPFAWIRQRSRWQKGYAMTWASHMRDPARLWRDLGPKRFWGIQVLFIGSLSQSFLTPVLWSFWLLALGLPHPLEPMLPTGAMLALGTLFLAAELVNITVGLWATRGPKHRHLMKWVPSLHVYFPLAALSSYKALYEWVTRPFYWDKTAHGAVSEATGESPELLPILLLTRPVHVPDTTDPALFFPNRPAHAEMPARLHLSTPALAATGTDDEETSVYPVLTIVSTGAGAGNKRRADRKTYVPGTAIAQAWARSSLETQLSFAGF